MEKKQITLLAALFVLFVILVVVFFQLGGKDNKPLTASTIGVDQGQDSTDAAAIRVVNLYYLSEAGPFLLPEEREIFERTSVTLMAKQTIHELLSGSRQGNISPFPPDTRLKDLFFTEDGTAYVDVSREIQESQYFGSSAGIAAVYSLVNSLALNFEEIKRVFILIDGRENQTLGGHVDLTRAFFPRKDIISQ